MLDRFEEYRTDEAIVWSDQAFTYGWLLNRIREWDGVLADENLVPGSVVAIEADFSPTSIALFLALTNRRCISVPLTESTDTKNDECKSIAQCGMSFHIGADDRVSIERLSHKADHELYRALWDECNPGLVVFSSGSTGQSKAAVHNLTALLKKFEVRRQKLRSITFLLFDHLGGINTLLYQLSNGGCTIALSDRSPSSVLAAVEAHNVELLPTSPTFFNLILLSGAHKNHDLSSLKIMTYGTEPMQESVLKRFHALFPWIRLQQTYGVSEMGVLRTKSKSSDSLWVKIGGKEFKTRIVDGILQIKSQSAMLGYLNHPSPFTEDGWFSSGDKVEVDGEYIRFLGRESEIINVGGEKVYPAEVESVLKELEEVAEAAVYAGENPIVGSVVCADVLPSEEEYDPKMLVRKIKKYCASRLQLYKVPAKVKIVQERLHGERFKLMRRREE